MRSHPGPASAMKGGDSVLITTHPKGKAPGISRRPPDKPQFPERACFSTTTRWGRLSPCSLAQGGQVRESRRVPDNRHD